MILILSPQKFQKDLNADTGVAPEPPFWTVFGHVVERIARVLGQALQRGIRMVGIEIEEVVNRMVVKTVGQP